MFLPSSALLVICTAGHMRASAPPGLGRGSVAVSGVGGQRAKALEELTCPRLDAGFGCTPSSMRRASRCVADPVPRVTLGAKPQVREWNCSRPRFSAHALCEATRRRRNGGLDMRPLLKRLARNLKGRVPAGMTGYGRHLTGRTHEWGTKASRRHRQPAQCPHLPPPSRPL
eukprot:scaffold1439_cov404-Prasinococcus_capsulatus_cf.AAC.12